ncbi:MAG: hypothetical protein Q9206_001399 [Seirophora lacunosa]
MSRRPPNPAAERAAQNQHTIKTLLKLEGNKSCADCKRNKPARKIENFIRTKYESKRWVMEGPMPDPSTLDTEGDDDVVSPLEAYILFKTILTHAIQPLNVVQEKAKMERSSSQRLASTPSQASKPTPKPTPNVDLFGDIPTPPARPSTTDTPGVHPPPSKAAPNPAKQQKQGDSLLGLDFFGAPPSASYAKPSSASTPGSSAVPSRPDLKQSILSLYASAPRTQSQPQQESQDVFGGMQSPTTQQASGLDDAFSGLNFASTPSAAPQKAQLVPKNDPFANFSKPSAQRSSFASPSVTSPRPISGGGFFDTGSKPAPKPAIASKPPTQATQPFRPPSASNGLGDFSFASTTAPVTKSAASGASNDLFDFSDPAPSQPTVASKPPPPSSTLDSAFNLSAPKSVSQPTPKSAPLAPVSSSAFSGFSNDDPWGSNNAWATPEPSTAAKPSSEIRSSAITTTNDFSSWGNSTSSSHPGGGSTSKQTPKIIADEDFGGWNSAAPETPAASNPPLQSTSKPSGGGFGASEDLFSNVWE